MQPADHDLTATILHVSDPQFGQYHRFTSDDPLAGHLLSDLARLADLGARRIDLVILSGDIAEQGKRAEYDQALAFIDQLLPDLDLPRDRLVVVPGNHDVSWDLCRAHFAECSADDIEARPPYDKKWRHYREFVTKPNPWAPGSRST